MQKQKDNFLVNASHIFLLYSLAVPQPVYNLLGKYHQFFMAHDSRLLDIIIIVFCFSILLPVCLISIEGAIRFVNKKIYIIIHFLLISSLLTLYLLPMIKFHVGFLYNAYIQISLAAVSGIVLSYLLFRIKQFNYFLTFMTPIVFLLCGYFLWHLISSDVLIDQHPQLSSFNKTKKNINVLLLICDEFPATSLMNEKMEIDQERYPNLSRLVENSYWFRNATTVSDDTLKGAVPAILTGRYPDKINHQTKSIFTVLSESHHFNVYETYSNFCPQKLLATQESLNDRLKLLISDMSVIYLHILLPVEFAKSLPIITQDWKNFIKHEPSEKEGLDRLWEERLVTYYKFIHGINKTDMPQFSFLHVLFPHIPWSYVPSGQRYNLKVKGLFGVPGVNRGEMWDSNLWNTQQAYQRHLLQVGFVDTLIGKMIAKLKNEGIYDQTLIIITADHGVSFIPNDSRRKLTPKNKYEIMSVPLIMKLPHQKHKVILDNNIESIDIFPTILDVLEIDIPWKLDGSSTIDPKRPERPEKICFKQNRMEKSVKLTFEKMMLNGLQEIVENKVKQFGSGNSELLYNFGRHSDLVGHDLNEFYVDDNSVNNMKIEMDNQLLSNIDTNENIPLSPTPITGHIYSENPKDFESLYLALISNNTIMSVTKAYKNTLYEGAFLFFVSPAFQTKLNDLDVFIILETNNHMIRLMKIDY